MSVAIRGPVVFNDDCGLWTGKDDIRNIHTALVSDLLLRSRVNFLHYVITGQRQLRINRSCCIDPRKEGALNFVTELVSRISIQQPYEYVGKLLLVRAMMHHPKNVELFGQALRQRR
ncbi:hypothetical protein BAUR920_00879 [Brevibacterium aurantiacum]|uniref:Uncharacterized protein n=1 Tax=Brevibacterium aurantiacum TaxID=273384 RepID=A0A2H1IBG0_BREAU|nr:hypothetical protein BAUR920_00879 [Brevibacterium aurantiacum]SMX81002.1 hypothetical protein BAUR9175_01898 [Brevibacterium aurantiacum]